MKRLSLKYLLFFVAICAVMGASAQHTERDFIRRGNRLYADSLFVKAEVEYRRALDINPQSVEAMYNLGNSLLNQQKPEEAMKMYQAAALQIPTNRKNIAIDDIDKVRLAQIYHNMGVLLQNSQQLDACIDSYKNSLRNNPFDHETRYNLTLAMKQRQEQQQQNQNQQQEQEQQKEEEKKEQEQQEKNQTRQEQEQQQQPQQEQDMSKENAEQLLNAIMQDEKDIQEKVKKAMQEVQPRRFEKDW